MADGSRSVAKDVKVTGPRGGNGETWGLAVRVFGNVNTTSGLLIIGGYHFNVF